MMDEISKNGRHPRVLEELQKQHTFSRRVPIRPRDAGSNSFRPNLPALKLDPPTHPVLPPFHHQLLELMVILLFRIRFRSED
jgi:hypothetical protein